VTGFRSAGEWRRKNEALAVGRRGPSGAARVAGR
jgi:hypothetical protein